MPDYSLNWTARSSVYKVDKGVSDATRPLDGGSAETGDLSASSLPWSGTVSENGTLIVTTNPGQS